MIKTISRRQFFAASAALPFALRGLAQPAPASAWAYLGTDKGQGIYRARWNAVSGEFGQPELAIAAERPDFFALHPTAPVLYSVNSVVESKGAVSSFHIDRETGALTLLKKVSSHGDGPCFVSVDSTGHMAFVANYSGGSFAAYQTGSDGHMREVGSIDCAHDPTCGNTGPVTDRQDKSHLHCTTIAPGNRFVVVCDLGKDSIEVVGFDAAKATLGKRTRCTARPGTGPRHVAFHPNGRWMYCMHEIDCTIDLYDWSTEHGVPKLSLRNGSTVSTMAQGASPQGSTGCEILVSREGRHVYACTRGEDKVLVYAVDPHTGLLAEQQRLSSGGHVPRYIALDPSERWLVSCNQGAPGNLAVFSRSPETGRLSETPRVFAADTPMFLQWV